MKEINPAIVVVAYNRSKSLTRVLRSLDNAVYNSSVTLIISIDNGDNKDILNIANDFKWKYGLKKVIYRKKNLGLKKHILTCAEYSEEFGSIIMLEDDIYVSRYFYVYTQEAIKEYMNDDKIAGISLYSHMYNVVAFQPFMPIADCSDVYFMQFASSWGQCWTDKQWINFKEWMKANDGTISIKDNMSLSIIKWSDSSWLKYFIKYLVDNNKYFVYPRVSFTTNFSDAGTHVQGESYDYQVNLANGFNNFKFESLEKSLSIYDVYFEIKPAIINKFNDELKEYNYEVDLYGKKRLDMIKKEYILTSRSVKNKIMSFGRNLKPLENNIINNIKGEKLYLAKVIDVKDEDKTNKKIIDEFNYFYTNTVSWKYCIELLKYKLRCRMKFK